VTLVGTRSNRGAVGARVEVVLPAAGGATRSIFRTVGAGSSFGGSPHRQQIGLGDAAKIVRIQVLWPASGLRQVFEEARPGGSYEVREGEAALRPARRTQ
jgi:hypothetical protein